MICVRKIYLKNVSILLTIVQLSANVAVSV